MIATSPHHILTRVLAVELLLGCSLVSSFAASSFTGLGFLPGKVHSFAHAVSGDGKVVVGYSSSTLSIFECFSWYQAFRWTAEDGMTGLGYLPGGEFSEARAVSSDGNVIVGRSGTKLSDQAFRWTKADGMIGLGYLPGGKASHAEAASGDGSVVVGRAFGTSRTDAFRWTAAGGIAALDHSKGKFDGGATGVSADGSVIIGWRVFANDDRIFRWTVGSGMVGLGCVPRGWHYSEPTANSSDGNVITVMAESASVRTSFRWTADGGTVRLGHLRDLCATGMTGDGSVVVGFSRSKSGYESFIWDSVKGVRGLQSLLVDEYHVDLTGWGPLMARGISADGKTIVGDGKHNDHDEAWVAHLDKPLNAPAGKERGK